MRTFFHQGRGVRTHSPHRADSRCRESLAPSPAGFMMARRRAGAPAELPHTSQKGNGRRRGSVDY